MSVALNFREFTIDDTAEVTELDFWSEIKQEDEYREQIERNWELEREYYVAEAHCFWCGRHTDHFAEHDDEVERGLVEYGDNGSVYVTEKGERYLKALKYANAGDDNALADLREMRSAW